jgi:hypothetical protein
VSEVKVEVSEDFLKAFQAWAETFSVLGEVPSWERTNFVEEAVSVEVDLIVAGFTAGVITRQQFDGLAKLHLIRAKEHRELALYSQRFANGAENRFAAYGVTLNENDAAPANKEEER